MFARIKQLLTGAAHSQFGRRFALLAGGAAVGQVVLVASAPLLTRLYSPVDIGVWGSFAAAVSVVSLVGALRFELAIPLAKSDLRASELLVVSFGVLCVCSAAAGVATALLPPLPVFPPLARRLFPIAILAGGAYQIVTHWAIRNGAFESLARTRVVQAMSAVATQVAGAFVLQGPAGLLIGDIVGRAGGTTTLARAAIRESRIALGSLTWSGLWIAAVEARRFPLISAWSTLLNAAGVQIPVLVIASLYGAQSAGWFSLASRAFGIPVFVVASAMAQVYFGEASRRVSDSTPLWPLFKRVTAALLTAGAVPSLIAASAGEPLFALVFGDTWRASGRYVEYLALAYLLQLVVSPVSQTLTILGRQEIQAAWDVLRLCAVATALGGTWYVGGDAEIAILVYSAVLSGCYLILLGISAIIVRRSDEHIREHHRRDEALAPARVGNT